MVWNSPEKQYLNTSKKTEISSTHNTNIKYIITEWTLVSECNNFDSSAFSGVADLTPELPVSVGTVLIVRCEKPSRFAIMSGDKTLTCQLG